MKNDEIVKYIVACKQESEDARTTRQEVWDKCWNAFNCYQDYSKKEDWQSKIFIPKANTFVEQATSAVKKALVYSPDMQFFNIEGVDEKDKKYAPLVQKLIKFWFKRIDFVSTFTNATRVAFITGYSPVKLFWKKEPVYKIEKNLDEKGNITLSPEKTYDSKLCIVPIDPYNMFPDPYTDGINKPKYRIERSWVDLADIKRLAEEGIYKNVNDLLNDYAPDEYKKTLERLGIDTDNASEYRKKVLIYEFWGDIYDKDGDLQYENCLAVVANEKYLLRGPIDNPFWHKRSPYIDVIPRPYPFRVYGQGLIEFILNLQFAINNFANMIMDDLNIAIMKAFEADINRIENPEDLRSIAPGDIIKTQSGTTPAIRPIFTGDTSGIQIALNALYLLDREAQNNTGVTENLIGAPTSKGRPTAKEISIKTAQALGIFDSMARELEEKALSKMVEMSYFLILQFMDDFSSPTIQNILGDEGLFLVNMDTDQRKAEIMGNYNFQASGISIMFDRQEMAEKLLTLLGIIGKDQQLAMQTDRRKVLEKLIHNLNLGRLEDYLTPQGQNIPTPIRRQNAF